MRRSGLRPSQASWKPLSTLGVRLRLTSIAQGRRPGRVRRSCDVVVGEQPGQKIAAVEAQHGIERVEGLGPSRDDFIILGVGKLPCHWLVSIWLAPRYLRKARIFRNKGVLPMTTTVTAAAVSKNFGAYQDAAVRDPVIITKNGRPRTVLLAYEDFVRLSKRDRRVDLTAELSADEIAAVEASEMEPGLHHLNDELPGTKSLTAKNAAG